MRINKRVAALIAAGCLSCAAPLVKDFEGRSLVAYLDPVGIPTICEGIIQGVELGDTATPAECDALLQNHMLRTLFGLAGCVDEGRDLNPNQWAAMVSWAYNVGTGAACSSTLVRKVNAGAAPHDWCGELKRWVYAGGRELSGLVRRREAEYQLCVSS